MNFYILQTVRKNLFKNKRSYILFLMQIAISFMLMSVFSSISSSLDVEYESIKKDKAAHSIQFMISADTPIGGNFTYDDYTHIKNKYGDILSASLVMRTELLYLNKNDNWMTFSAYFATDEFFNNVYFNETIPSFNDEKTIYAPDNFVNTVKNSIPLTTGQATMDIKSLSGYQIKNINEISNGTDYVYHTKIIDYEYQSQEKTDLNNSVVLPISLASQIDSKNAVTLLTINFFSETDVNVISEIIEYIEKVHTDITSSCEFTTKMGEFRHEYDSQIMLAQIFKMIGIVCFLIVSIGFVGLILIIIENRKKVISIGIALGAKYNQLYFEIAAEILTVIISGCIVGFAASQIVLTVIKNNLTYFNLMPDYIVMQLIFLFNICASILISLIALNRIIKISPNDILKSN